LALATEVVVPGDCSSVQEPNSSAVSTGTAGASGPQERSQSYIKTVILLLFYCVIFITRFYCDNFITGLFITCFVTVFEHNHVTKMAQDCVESTVVTVKNCCIFSQDLSSHVLSQFLSTIM